MKCNKICHWLKNEPGCELPQELRSHLEACPHCRRIWQEQSSLDRTLRRLPPIPPPRYLKETVLARLSNEEQAPVRISWVPAAAAALSLLLAVVLLWSGLRFNSPDSKSSKPWQHPIELTLPTSNDTAATITPVASLAPAVYPVWPKDEDAILPQDLQILASVYPAPPKGFRVEILLDDQNLASQVSLEGELITLEPKGLSPGTHNLEFKLMQGSQVYSSSKITFFLMEAPS